MIEQPAPAAAAAWWFLAIPEEEEEIMQEKERVKLTTQASTCKAHVI